MIYNSHAPNKEIIYIVKGVRDIPVQKKENKSNHFLSLHSVVGKKNSLNNKIGPSRFQTYYLRIISPTV